MTDKNIEWQMDHYGNHRIKVGGAVGEPARYESPAIIQVDSKTYIAVTQYYGCDGFEPEKVYELVPVESKSANTEECNIFRTEEPCVHNKSVKDVIEIGE
jgi:hypothetical protein